MKKNDNIVRDLTETIWAANKEYCKVDIIMTMCNNTPEKSLNQQDYDNWIISPIYKNKNYNV